MPANKSTPPVPNIQASDHSVVNTGDGVAVGRDVYGPVIVAREGAHVTVTVQGENVRDKELAYLDALLRRYAYWESHYTPLAGIAEVRAAVKDGPRLDLPMPFIPPGFEKLIEHGYGERTEVRRVPVDNLRDAVTEHRRIVLLGDPGSGKTTTLWRLAYDYAVAAREDASAPLPVLSSLGGYIDDSPFDAYLARTLGPLAPYLETYRASGRLILLLDGLNEMPQREYARRVERIREVLDRQPAETVVVTCRALDYVVRLERLQPVQVSPLDPDRIRQFVHHYLGEAAGEHLFWALVGGDEGYDLWQTWQRGGGTWTEFWTADKMPEKVHSKTTITQDFLWARLRETPPVMLSLCSNPYLLLMTAQVYTGAGGALPANRGRLFAAFVDTLLAREKKRDPDQWIDGAQIECGLSALAYDMQTKRGQGTTVERDWALDRLCRALPDCDIDLLLYLASSATLLDASDQTVRFYHQLLQEYFAAREMGRRASNGVSWDDYWSPERWWKPSGWEETTILMAGMQKDASALLATIASVNPLIAAHCLLESGAPVNNATRQEIVARLVDTIETPRIPALFRARAGDLLGRLGDLRPGVGVITLSLLAGEGTRMGGMPDIVWCEVPDGPFLMGSDDGDSDEKPQHPVSLSTFYISRYPITQAQFAAFVHAGGYADERYWPEAKKDGWWQKGQFKGRFDSEPRNKPVEYGLPFNLSNHPVVGISWYEALAFCRWLTEKLRMADSKLYDVQGNEVALCVRPAERMQLEIRLPSEAEWEKAASWEKSRETGRQGKGCKRRYPWGDDTDPNKANYMETGIGSTSAVGCFPGGMSPYGVLDMSGNVWEWCSSLYRDYPYCPGDGRENLETDGIFVLRGGSFDYNIDAVQCSSRFRYYSNLRYGNLGFRVCAVKWQE